MCRRRKRKRLLMSAESERQTLLQHLTELRKRLLWSLLIMGAGMGICYMFVDPIYGFLVKPLAQSMGPDDSHRMIYTSLTEAFFTTMKVSFFAGIFLTFPFLLWQVWLFIAPGLYKNERRAFLPFIIATPFLFFLGGACLYYLILPMAWPFFLSFQTTSTETHLPIQLEAKISEYLDFVMGLIFAFGLCFQLPILLTLMGKAGMITAESLAARRKYAIVIIFVVAAFLTPPDVLSQVLLAVPLLLLYELSIFLVRHVQKPAKPL